MKRENPSHAPTDDEDVSAGPRLDFEPAPLPAAEPNHDAACRCGERGRREGEENFPGCKALKNHKTGKYSHRNQAMKTPTAMTAALQVRGCTGNPFHPRRRAAALPC